MKINSHFKSKLKPIVFLTIVFFPSVHFAGDSLSDFTSKIKKFTLTNGMRVIVVEKPDSPTISFAMYIRTGGLDDESGKSGLAHMFEHMLFKGTKTVGTKNFEKEAPLLDKIDRAYEKLQKENGDQTEIQELRNQIEKLEQEHSAYVLNEEFWKIYEQAGAADLNASTGYDFTNYVVSLPKNYLPLWITMEADRIANPVLREFYKERDVVLEERRLRIDNSPDGKLWEGFLAAAYMAHPYGRPIVGWESDISRVTRSDAEKFFKDHYSINRLVLCVVGGVKASEFEKLLKIHFEPIKSQLAQSVSNIPIEPKQEGERRVTVEYDAEEKFLVGYHRPDMMSLDEAALNVLEDALTQGRTSRLYRSLVEQKRVASSIWAAASAPGERDPSLFMVGGSPRMPHSSEEVEKGIYEEIEKIKKDGISEMELQKIKNNMESDVIRGLVSNIGLASQLAYYESQAGDWTYLLRVIDQIRVVTSADVKRVAQAYLTSSNRTVAILRRKAK
jgi:predicted Zn-dependent peptidase